MTLISPPCGDPAYTVTVVAIGTISVTTNDASATFSIAGPSNYNGSGTLWTQTNAPVGTYSITFGAIPGQNTPTDTNKTLTSGGTITFSGTYTPATGSVSFTSTPSGAAVYIDNTLQVGITTPSPQITGLSPGTGNHTYKLTLGGYTDATGTFSVAAGQNTPVSVSLLTVANIQAQSINVSPSNPCIEGTCVVTVTATWINNGQTLGSFTPSISVTGTHTVDETYGSQNLAGGTTVTKTFTVRGLTANGSPHTICPVPN